MQRWPHVCGFLQRGTKAARQLPEATTDLVYGACLATDAEHYTTLSEKIPPLELASLMHEYFNLLTRPVERHHGTITNTFADSMMCFWVDQEPGKNACKRACKAALEIRQAVRGFNEKHEDRALRTRIGLHVGWIAIGNVGGSGHYTYSVTGDTANVASRLQELNKDYGTQILASSSIVENVDDFVVRHVGSIVPRGRSSAVSIFELLNRRGEATDR